MKTDTTPAIHRTYTTLADAALYWGEPDLLLVLKDLVAKGYNEITMDRLSPQQRPESRLQERLRDPYCRVLDHLRATLIDKLKTEKLVAFAFHAGSLPGAPRSSVYSGRWRVLEPNFQTNTASGSGLDLFDVLVSTPESGPTIASGSVLVFDDRAKAVRFEGREVSLQPRNYQLLSELAKRVKSGCPLISKEQLHKAIFSDAASDNTLTKLISTLRQELETLRVPLSTGDELIQNRSRRGYMLNLPAHQIVMAQENSPPQSSHNPPTPVG